MNIPFDQIRDWIPLARQAEWSAAGLARVCSVSMRTLERRFHHRMGKAPLVWLNELRQKQAVELLRNGSSIKETAAELGYQHSAHFTRDFKKRWGRCPTTLADSPTGPEKGDTPQKTARRAKNQTHRWPARLADRVSLFVGTLILPLSPVLFAANVLLDFD